MDAGVRKEGRGCRDGMLPDGPGKGGRFSRRHRARQSAAADQSAGKTGVQNHQLFALNGREHAAKVAAGERRLRFAIAEQQVSEAVVAGGEHAVRTQVQNGQIVLIGFAEGVGDGGVQCVACADGTVLDGQPGNPRAYAEQRGGDHLDIAGDGAAQVGLGDKVGAGDQQRTHIRPGNRRQTERQRQRQQRQDSAHRFPSFHLWNAPP